MLLLSFDLLFRLLLALLVFLHVIEKIDDLLGSVLDNAHQINFFVLAIPNDLGDMCPQFSIFLGRL